MNDPHPTCCNSRLDMKKFTNCLLFLSTLLASVSCYTPADIHNECEPCIYKAHGSFIPHPTVCSKYYYCTIGGAWVIRNCPASTFFVAEYGYCVDVRTTKEKACPYDLGNNENIGKDIGLLDECAGRTTTTMTSQPNSTDVSGESTTTGMDGGKTDSVGDKTTAASGGETPNITIVLAVLLAVTFGLLLAVLLGIFLYKKRQKRRRPKNFYSRKLPGSAAANRNVLPPPTGNAAYLSNSLLKETNVDDAGSEEYEVPLTEGAEYTYSEIPEASNNRPQHMPRPVMALPTITPPTPEGNKSVYSELVSPSDVSDTYTHPGDYESTTDNHIYSARSDEDHEYSGAEPGDDEEPYDYCQPEIANPTLSFKRGASSSPATTPESPPYYVDPIPDLALNVEPGHQYHTLEPPTNG